MLEGAKRYELSEASIMKYYCTTTVGGDILAVHIHTGCKHIYIRTDILAVRTNILAVRAHY